jgi:serine/threonine-protein kinase ATR
LHEGNNLAFKEIINDLRLTVAKSLTTNSVTSLQSCHDSILKLHALAEVESIACSGNDEGHSRSRTRGVLASRLDILGGYISDKQYLLGLRRAIMELT